MRRTAVTTSPPDTLGEATSPATMAHVAKRAGVALGTVSNVINQPHKVSETTRLRVRKAIDDLGFVPNRAAQALAGGTSNTIGFVMIDLANSFFVDIARGAESAAQAEGKSVLLANSDVQVSKQEAYLTLFDEEHVAGILLAPLPYSMESTDLVRKHGRPLVIVNDSVARADSCSVMVNDEHGGYLAARHLIELGRSRLSFVGGPDELLAVHARHEGARRAVAETNGAVELQFIPTDQVRVEDGRKAGHLIARMPGDERPDGIVAAADLLALGILQSVLSETDLRFPRDIAIVGYDNNRLVWDSVIPISTLSQPGEEMGRIATELLLDEIRNPGTHEHRTIVLEPELIARESSVGARP